MGHDFESPVPREPVPPRPPWLVHVGLFVLAGVFCVGVRLAFPSDPLIWDDAYYVPKAEAVAAGTPVCFRPGDYMNFRIAIVLPMAAAIRLFGENMFSYWLVALGYAFAEGGFCYLVGRRLAGWPVGLAAAALLAAHPISVYDGSLLLPDHALNAWFTMSVWALLHCRAGRGSRRRLVWGLLSGLLLLLGYATRMTFLFLAPALLFVPRKKRYWLPLAGIASAFAIGWIVESSLHFAFSGDWLNRLRNTGEVYQFWLRRLHLSGGWTELCTRWSHPFQNVYGWMPLTIGSGVLAVGAMIVGGWRGRLLGVWFLLPTLIVMFGVRSFDPWTALLHPNVNYLAMPATAAVITLAWAGVSLSKLLARERRAIRAGLQVAGTLLLVGACIYCLIENRRRVVSDPGHPWRLARAIDSEYREAGRPLPVYANHWALPMVRLLADDRAKERLHDARAVIDAGEAFPSGSIVFLDKHALATHDRNRFRKLQRADPPRLPAAEELLSPRIAHPPPHWRLLAGGWRTRFDWYVLYRVHEPGESFGRPVDMLTGGGFWADDGKTLSGWHCFGRGKHGTIEPVDSPAGVGVRIHRAKGSGHTFYLITGESGDIGNLKQGRHPLDCDRVPVDPKSLYQVRFLARLHRDHPGYAIVRLYEFGPRHLRSEDVTGATYRVLLTPTSNWQAASLAFRVDHKTQYLRIGFSTDAGVSLDLADVKLREYAPRRKRAD